MSKQAGVSSASSVLLSWVEALPLKQQTLLLSAIRGPDGVGKSNKVKEVLKYYRWCVLVDADELSGFMSLEYPSVKAVDSFIKDIEEYPLHWVLHFYRACAILGNKYGFWKHIYERLAKRLHLNPQTPAEVERSK